MHNKKTIKQQGFTLLEMLVVLVIIGLLAGLVGPRLFGKVDASKQKTAKVQVKMIKGALETMRLDISRFPTSEEGLSFLYNTPKDELLKQKWHGPYLDEEAPLDPWSNPFQYKKLNNQSKPFLLYSMGANGKKGGTGYDQDIGYTE